MSPRRQIASPPAPAFARRNRTARRPPPGSPATANAARRPEPRPPTTPVPDRPFPASRNVAEVTSTPLRRRGQRQRERHRRVEPVPMQSDIEIPVAVTPVQPEERDVAGPFPWLMIRLGQRGQHRPPRPQRLDRAPVQRTGDRLDPRCGWRRPCPPPHPPRERASGRATSPAARRCGPVRGRGDRRRSATASFNGCTSHSTVPYGFGRAPTAPRPPTCGPAPAARTSRRNNSVGFACRGSTPSSSGPSSVSRAVQPAPGNARAACNDGVQRGQQIGTVGDQILDPAREPRARDRPPSPPNSQRRSSLVSRPDSVAENAPSAASKT